MRRLEPLLVIAVVAVLVVLPLALDGGPRTAGEWAGAASLVLGCGLLAGRRRFPALVLVAGPALLLVPLVLGPEPPDGALAFVAGYAAVTAERFGGRAAWAAGGAFAAYLALIYAVSHDDTIGLVMLTVPGYVAGLLVRHRRETAEALAGRAAELEVERELFAQVSVANERARIAAELHDIVGHALSVMVVQAAAGQRLVDRRPEAARASLEAVAESARQGRADLRRLIDLLTGTEVLTPDLDLVDEVVTRAARSGLRVTCRFEGDRDGVDARAGHIAFRVVQEGLTNALRYAPGATVRILVRGEPGRALTVRVENGAAAGAPLGVGGSGRGLTGLRERVAEYGGRLDAGPLAGGGWRLEAELRHPRRPPPLPRTEQSADPSIA